MTIPVAEMSNLPFPSGLIAARTLYTRSNGHLERDVYAGNAGCAFGKPDSCVEGGNSDFQSIGMILDTVDDLDGIDPSIGPPTLVHGTGQITLTAIAGNNVLFRTASGRTGSYSLTTRRATLAPAPR